MQNIHSSRFYKDMTKKTIDKIEYVTMTKEIEIHGFMKLLIEMILYKAVWFVLLSGACEHHLEANRLKYDRRSFISFEMVQEEYWNEIRRSKGTLCTNLSVLGDVKFT